MSKPIKIRRGRKPSNNLFKGYRLRIVTIKFIDQSGIEMVYYSRYLDKTLYYVVDRSYSDKYSKYLRSSQPYDVVSLLIEGIHRLLGDKSTVEADLSTAKVRCKARLQAFLNDKAKIDRLEK